MAAHAFAVGITSCIADWEWRGKEQRQAGADTEINRYGAEELRGLAEVGVPTRLCRLNRLGSWTGLEVETAISAGATHLFLPMVEYPYEVEVLLTLVAGRCPVGILLETAAAASKAADFASLPLFAVYVGLNDLAIDLGNPSIFTTLADGTIDQIRQALPATRFGVGGATVVDRGTPIPFPLLLGEMARLGTSFTFLRRSFRRDIEGRSWAEELGRIQDLWTRMQTRDDNSVARGHTDFCERVAEVSLTNTVR